MSFSKDPFGLFRLRNQVEWAHFQPMLSNFGPAKADRALKNGPFGATNRSKTGQKHCFPNLYPCPVLVPKRMYTAHFEPLLSRFHLLSVSYLICP